MAQRSSDVAIGKGHPRREVSACSESPALPRPRPPVPDAVLRCVVRCRRAGRDLDYLDQTGRHERLGPAWPHAFRVGSGEQRSEVACTPTPGSAELEPGRDLLTLQAEDGLLRHPQGSGSLVQCEERRQFDRARRARGHGHYGSQLPEVAGVG